MNPIERRDFDGLCVSCRAAVAFGLYRVYTIDVAAQRFAEQADGRFAIVPPKFKRVIEIASCAEHPLGWEYPFCPELIEYRPEDLPAKWRELDALAADELRAETVLNQLTQLGS